MTPEEFKQARRKLGLSLSQVAELLQLGNEDNPERWKEAARTIRRWEAGQRDIPGPVAVIMRWLLSGRRPSVPAPRRTGRPAAE